MRLQLNCQSAVLVSCAVLLVSVSASADDALRVGTDTLVYTDSDNVVVVTPQVSIAYDLDDEGSQLAARVAVDAISAASVDVVSQATNRFSEVRTEVGLSASYEVRGVLPGVSYRFSTEPDYVSHGGRLGTSMPLRSKDTTLAFGYGLTVDTVGRSGTPRSLFSESLSTHAADISLSQVFGPLTVARAAYTLTVQDGYLEKPYRHVPLFTEGSLASAQADGVTLGIDNFASYALSGRPTEEVPDRRYRHAFAWRLLRFLPSWKASLRLDYQLYLDSWGVLSNLVEPALYKEFSPGWSARWFLRMYHQTGADFWRRTYVVSEGQVPLWRTLDRSLSPYLSMTAGGRVEWKIGPIATYLDAQAMHTTFSGSLLIDSRIALISQIGLRWTP